MSDYIKRDGVMMVLGQSKTLTDGMRSVFMIPSADVVEVSKILKTADEQERIGYIQTAGTLRSIVWKKQKGREI